MSASLFMDARTWLSDPRRKPVAVTQVADAGDVLKLERLAAREGFEAVVCYFADTGELELRQLLLCQTAANGTPKLVVLTHDSSDARGIIGGTKLLNAALGSKRSSGTGPEPPPVLFVSVGTSSLAPRGVLQLLPFSQPQALPQPRDIVSWARMHAHEPADIPRLSALAGSDNQACLRVFDAMTCTADSDVGISDVARSLELMSACDMVSRRTCQAERTDSDMCNDVASTLVACSLVGVWGAVQRIPEKVVLVSWTKEKQAEAVKTRRRRLVTAATLSTATGESP